MKNTRSISVSKTDTGFFVTNGSRSTRLIEDDENYWQAHNSSDIVGAWTNLEDALRALIDNPQVLEAGVASPSAFPGLLAAARQWDVDEAALEAFLKRASRANQRKDQYEITGGMPVKAAHFVAAVVTLERRGIKRPARGQIEDQMRAQGFLPKGGHVTIQDLMYNRIGPSNRHAKNRPGETPEQWRRRNELAIILKNHRPCQAKSTKAGQAWFKKYGQAFLAAAKEGKLQYTA